MFCIEEEGGIGLPVQNHQLIKADPFVLSKSEVLYAVETYLKREGYVTRKAVESAGIDLVGENEYHTLFIEAQGNYAEHHEKEMVVSSSQLDTHFSRQIVRLLQNYEKNPGKTLVMANPDTPRMRRTASLIKQAIEDLGIVQFWVKDNGNIEWN